MSAWMLQVVDERIAGREALVLELHERRAIAALIGRRGLEPCHERVLFQELRDRPAQLTRAVTVNDTQDLFDR